MSDPIKSFTIWVDKCLSFFTVSYFLKMFLTGHGKIWHGRLDIVISSNPEITDSDTAESNNGITLILEKGYVY